MRSLLGSLRDDKNIGQPLPVVWRTFMHNGVEFRRGMLCLIASAPGVGKSLVGNTIAVRAGVPTLYESADTDAYTVSTRIGAMLSNQSINMVETKLEEIKPLLRKLDYIRWSFNPTMSIEDIVADVKAFDVMYGEPPHLIVVDNLSNMVNAEPNPYLAHRFNVEALNLLAKESGACVLVLHHLTGEYESGDRPPPQSALEGKVAKLPGLVLTLWDGTYGDLGVAICKNRFGPADAGGKLRCYLAAEKGKVKISDRY